MEWTIKTLYFATAAAGGTVLLVQTVMLLFGGGDSDVAHTDGHVDIGAADSGEPHGHDAGLGLLSIRSCAAFLCFFGLTGLYGSSRGWSTEMTLFVSLAIGALMLVGVAWLFSMQRKLYSAGNIDPRNAVGRTARVYLKIPAANAGKGKVTVAIQGRTVEFSALSRGPEIPTGSEVRIARQITEDTFEVEPLV